jgi:Leucine-rich repeat (LRR) protein
LNLVELNLKINLIEVLENIQNLVKLEKLFISNNKLSDTESFIKLKNLNFLIEINFEGNPIEKYKLGYLK